MITQFPQNVPIQYPTGQWGFVGRVDIELAFCRKDGAPMTDDDKAEAHRLASFGGRFATGERAPYRNRSFASEAEAIEALEALDS